MKKSIKDVILSMRSMIYFDTLNSIIEQHIKDNKKDTITYGSKTTMKYNKWKK